MQEPFSSVQTISIHAPTRGATVLSVCKLHHFEFQSTLPREERQAVKNCLHLCPYFNPRSHERSDCLEACFLLNHVDFNPRSHERSDQDRQILFGQLYEFQSTLPREERQQYCTKNLFIFIQYRQ